MSNPLLAPWDGPFGLPGLRPDRARAFSARLRCRAGRARGRVRGHRRKPRGALVRQHDRGAGALGPTARPGRRRLLEPRRQRHERRDPGDRARDQPAPQPAFLAPADRPAHVRPHRGGRRRSGRADARAGAGARADGEALCPRRRAAGRGWPRAHAGDHAPALGARHGVFAECAEGRGRVDARARAGRPRRAAGELRRRRPRRRRSGAGREAMSLRSPAPRSSPS